ncbi:MAG: thermonuclease family protein [Patescibacteria group bacterium]|nr:thermonuclease family protein [Patescibacteria group bacterium]
MLDGDTFRFRKEDGTLQSVRLLGADAPESTKTRYRTTECFGIEAKKYLTELIKGKNVRIEFDETQQQIDLYGRYVAYVYFNDELINEKMIKE